MENYLHKREHAYWLTNCQSHHWWMTMPCQSHIHFLRTSAHFETFRSKQVWDHEFSITCVLMWNISTNIGVLNNTFGTQINFHLKKNYVSHWLKLKWCKEEKNRTKGKGTPPDPQPVHPATSWQVILVAMRPNFGQSLHSHYWTHPSCFIMKIFYFLRPNWSQFWCACL